MSKREERASVYGWHPCKNKWHAELGDGEPSPQPAKLPELERKNFGLICGACKSKLGSHLGYSCPWPLKTTFAVESGAAQEVSPPSPDKLKGALELIENYDSSCECDDHTQPECCANVPVTDCFCAHCIAGKALL
jgi:hypothetical protein